ncbi:hypothetical protein BSZ37_12625 [Rubrivirga marina]|uniref:Pyrrolo-quinoline quinone repeat domain-containing protein n=1 Tax=Rubrivirga marina TaxID=1196024 RepID=A0A271J130_9BACT|nr:hypothetical protein BSZ37_12625 [Rubrivirga marina]
MNYVVVSAPYPLNVHVALALTLAGLALAACSTAETADIDQVSPTLETLWTAGQPVGIAFSTIRKGAVDADRFYAIRERVGDGRALVAYDRRDGAEAWRQTVVGPCTVVPAGDVVYCPGDYLYALDARTGRVLWRHGTGRAEDSFQLVDADADAARVYGGVAGAADGTGRVVAVDARTGELVWERTFEGPGWKGIRMAAATLAPDGDDLFVSFSGEYAPPAIYSAAAVAALDPATGTERWRVVDGGPETDREGSALAFSGDLVLYTDSGGQEVVAVSRRARAVAWRAPYTPGSFSINAAPVVAGGRVYYTDTLGGVFAVDAATGRRAWAVERPGGFFTQLACGGLLYADDQRGALFDLGTGRHLGPLLADDEAIPGQAASADGVLYLSASSGVHAFACTG